MKAVASARYVRLSVFEVMTGYTVSALETKIKRGVLLEGHEYVRAPDGALLIDTRGFELWVENRRRAG